MTELLPYLLFIPIVYAETHYRFKYFLSYLYKPEPEIIADIPSRIEPRSALPLLIIVKDAHRFPIQLKRINVYICAQDTLLAGYDINESIQAPYWEKIMYLDIGELEPRDHQLNVEMIYSIQGRQKRCLNDNYRGTKHHPLPVYLASEPLPRIGECFYGDTHVHSTYSSDQVEFGASIESTIKMAKVMGMDFFCVTDHSYDLDDEPDNYLSLDPDLKKWSLFQDEVCRINQNHQPFIVIPGEEVSVSNSDGKTVHCLVFNSKQFFPGSGDSAERWPDTSCEMSLPELLNDLPESAMAFAAHPGEKPPFIQRLLINRGVWSDNDFAAKNLSGMQTINGADEKADKRGLLLWRQALLAGKKLYAICGSDAHGNFARFRQISVPFLSMVENYTHLFGQWRTGVYPDSVTANIEQLLNAIKHGHCFMTNGPALRCGLQQSRKGTHAQNIKRNFAKITVEAKSTTEFGALKTISLFGGKTGDAEEHLLRQWSPDSLQYDFKSIVNLGPSTPINYFRCEVVTINNRKAIYNPIWLAGGF